MKSSRERAVYILLGCLQVFIGLGAVGGGLMLVLDPSGESMGIPLELLKDSPFPDYLIPGLVLLVVNGIFSLVASRITFAGSRWTSKVAIGLGLFLMCWIAIQVIIFKGPHWLHILYFMLGFVELALGVQVRRIVRLSTS